MVSAAAGVFRIPADFTYTNNGDIMDKIISASQQARTGGGDMVVYYDDNMVHDREHVKLVQRLFGEALQKEEFSQKQCIPFFRGFCRKRIPERKSPTTFTFQKQVHSSCLKHWAENVRIGTVL